MLLLTLMTLALVAIGFGSSQNFTSINVENHKSKVLKITYENNDNTTAADIVYCTIKQDLILKLPILCTNYKFVSKINTQNFQLAMPVKMLRFSKNNHDILISAIDYNEYFWIIIIDLEAKSCTRSIIHRDEISGCLDSSNNMPKRLLVAQVSFIAFASAIIALYVLMIYKISPKLQRSYSQMRLV